MKYLLTLVLALLCFMGNAQAFKSKVFIVAENYEESQAESQFAKHLNKWGYWQVVYIKDSADILLDLNITKIKKDKIRGFVTVKKKDGTEISHSKVFKAQKHLTNGNNQFRALAIDIVVKYLRETKWE